jgi:hypothetical protein
MRVYKLNNMNKPLSPLLLKLLEEVAVDVHKVE